MDICKRPQEHRSHFRNLLIGLLKLELFSLKKFNLIRWTILDLFLSWHFVRLKFSDVKPSNETVNKVFPYSSDWFPRFKRFSCCHSVPTCAPKSNPFRTPRTVYRERTLTSQTDLNRSRAADFQSELKLLKQNWHLKKSGNTILRDLSYRNSGTRYPHTGTFEVLKNEAVNNAGSLSPLRRPQNVLDVLIPSDL